MSDVKNILQDTANWFKEAVPVPTDEKRSVQLGVHIEEFAEMFEALGGNGWTAVLAESLHKLGDSFKTQNVNFNDLGIDKKEFLDALTDQIVTAVGVAHMFRYDILGALQEVNRSNWSKFENGKCVFDENGKIRKGANYSKADLTPYF